MKTYLITEIVKAAENIPTWLGWTIAGILTAAVLVVVGSIIAEIIIDK